MNWLKKIEKKISVYTQPETVELVTQLVLHTANLELLKNEYVELAPIRGCCGPFKLSGTSLPVVEYTMFEKKIMEFIAVRVEIAKPDRISYLATIDSIKTSDPARHGEIIRMEARYKEPFEKLIGHLYQYFPFYRKVQKMEREISGDTV